MTRWGRAHTIVVVVCAVLVAASCTPPPTLTPDQQIDQIIHFVETKRGHTFLTRPDVQFVPDAQFQSDVLANIAVLHPDLDKAEVAFRALGWMTGSTSLFDWYQVAQSGGVVGFYDPTTKVLEVRGTTLTPYRREVIAHELTHALDDQRFGLDESFGDGFLGERTFASLVAIEGSAERVREAYHASMSAADQLQSVQEQLTLGGDPRLLSVPLALLTLTQVPYLQGLSFAQKAAALGVPAGLDETITRYPTTSEQAFDFDKYVADEPEAPVATPPADGTVVQSGSWGQFLLSMILDEGATIGSLESATRGWAGDSSVSWTSGTQDCLRIDVAMDTPTQLVALGNALVGWAGRHAGATVVALTDTSLRFTSCVG